jgi:hypothetical protein
MSGWRVIPEMRVSIAGIALALIQAFEQEAVERSIDTDRWTGNMLSTLLRKQKTPFPTSLNGGRAFMTQ